MATATSDADLDARLQHVVDVIFQQALPERSREEAPSASNGDLYATSDRSVARIGGNDAMRLGISARAFQELPALPFRRLLSFVDEHSQAALSQTSLLLYARCRTVSHGTPFRTRLARARGRQAAVEAAAVARLAAVVGDSGAAGTGLAIFNQTGGDAGSASTGVADSIPSGGILGLLGRRPLSTEDARAGIGMGVGTTVTSADAAGQVATTAAVPGSRVSTGGFSLPSLPSLGVSVSVSSMRTPVLSSLLAPWQTAVSASRPDAAATAGQLKPDDAGTGTAGSGQAVPTHRGRAPSLSDLQLPQSFSSRGSLGLGLGTNAGLGTGMGVGLGMGTGAGLGLGSFRLLGNSRGTPDGQLGLTSALTVPVDVTAADVPAGIRATAADTPLAAGTAADTDTQPVTVPPVTPASSTGSLGQLRLPSLQFGQMPSLAQLPQLPQMRVAQLGQLGQRLQTSTTAAAAGNSQASSAPALASPFTFRRYLSFTDTGAIQTGPMPAQAGPLAVEQPLLIGPSQPGLQPTEAHRPGALLDGSGTGHAAVTTDLSTDATSAPVPIVLVQSPIPTPSPPLTALESGADSAVVLEARSTAVAEAYSAVVPVATLSTFLGATEGGADEAHVGVAAVSDALTPMRRAGAVDALTATPRSPATTTARSPRPGHLTRGPSGSPIGITTTASPRRAQTLPSTVTAAATAENACGATGAALKPVGTAVKAVIPLDYRTAGALLGYLRGLEHAVLNLSNANDDACARLGTAASVRRHLLEQVRLEKSHRTRAEHDRDSALGQVGALTEVIGFLDRRLKDREGVDRQQVVTGHPYRCVVVGHTVPDKHHGHSTIGEHGHSTTSGHGHVTAGGHDRSDSSSDAFEAVAELDRTRAALNSTRAELDRTRTDFTEMRAELDKTKLQLLEARSGLAVARAGHDAVRPSSDSGAAGPAVSGEAAPAGQQDTVQDLMAQIRKLQASNAADRERWLWQKAVLTRALAETTGQ